MMTPIVFEGRFGWLHDAAPIDPSGAAGRLGVVLCAAFAQEEICTHHGLMLLADRLAAAGMPTIRFDYRGTGDSADGETTLETLAEDVARAADCLRQQCTVGAVALCGIRLGAAVAARAAATIDGLVGVAMLAPVIAGQAFLRETRAAASVNPLAQLDPVPKIDAGLALNTNGFLWSGALQQQVAAIDLLNAPPPAPQVLLATIRSDRKSPAYATRLREQGTTVTERPFTDYDAYVQDPTTHVMPHATFASVTAWLRDLPRPAALGAPAAPVEVTPSLSLADCQETAVCFGADGRNVGILCRPLSHAGAPVAALLLHEGSSHHIGNGRAYVALARRLARSGIASLRMDLTGMGDSRADGPRSPYFDPERRGEAVAGIDRLVEAGYARVVTFGLCSGADIAFQAGLADDRVAGIILINLPKFVWHYGDDLRLVTRDSKRTMRSYLRSTRSLAAWRRALRGDGDLIGIARVLSQRVVKRARHALRSLQPPLPGSERALVREQMRALAARGVRTQLIFSDEDVGLAEMTMHFGRAGRGLKAYAPAEMIVMGRADHHFNGTDVRRRYLDLVETTMREIAGPPQVAVREPARQTRLREATHGA